VIVERLGGIFDVYRRTASTRTAIALVAANAIPLIGVLFLGWSLLTILVIYWVENGIVGLWNVPKIILAQGSIVPTRWNMPPSAAAALSTLRLPGAGRAGLALFFIVHYGLFWLGHGFFVLNLPAFASFGASVLEPCIDTGTFPTFPDAGAACAPGPFGGLVGPSVALAAVALFLSHGASFLFNYLGRREYLNASPPVQMFAPYGRVVVLHLTIIFGAFIAALLGAPIGALIVLVVLKTAFDLRLHLREHIGTPLTSG
jgi:hypothetical protein